jgi:molybdopterin-guanine dinucleotide biosynthesis protein MobB
VAGADTMVICSPEKLALVKRHIETPSVHELLSRYFSDMDVVVTEGFKQSDLPKIEVHRAALSDTLFCRGAQHDPTLIAVASDSTWELDVPCLDLDNPVAVADFIEKRLTQSDG